MLYHTSQRERGISIVFEEGIKYRHNKTGNIYHYLAEVQPTHTVPSEFTTCLTATCSETLNKVKIYFEDNRWYYVTSDNPDMHENTSVKVLYERGSNLWLRSKDMFHELVVINGERKLRFERIENQ